MHSPGSHCSPHPQRCCEGLAEVPRGHCLPPDPGSPRRPVAVVRTRPSLLLPAARGLRDPGKDAWLLSLFSFLFRFVGLFFFLNFKYAPYQTDSPPLQPAGAAPDVWCNVVI